MHRLSRPRRLARAALTVALAATAILIAACGPNPNTIFHPRTDFNREVGHLFTLLIWLGTFVFVFVEGILIYTLVRYRRRGDGFQPEHVHGNTTLEIIWTIVPALILLVIAVPTVRTIFHTQAKARADALQVEVIGHQWWWEFRYPQYAVAGAGGRVDTLTTANELYLPIGRTVNFILHTKDVIHSFWIPSLAGKRDLIANHTNYLWFTPDSTTTAAFNGFCVEYCGTSHANMRFKAFAVTTAQFQSWVAHQQTPAAFGAAAPATSAVVPAAGAAGAPAATTAAANAPTNASQRAPKGAGMAAQTTTNKPALVGPATPPPAPVAQAGFIAFARDSLPSYTVPKTPIPADLHFNDALTGDAARGADLLTKGQGACLACHSIRGNPSMVGVIGPNLTHVGSRTTIAAGLYPNDAAHLARWIKNARKMKPGVVMPTIGLNEYDPIVKATMKAGLTDQQIADIVAYLQALK